jgi:hypothetical protein
MPQELIDGLGQILAVALVALATMVYNLGKQFVTAKLAQIKSTTKNENVCTAISGIENLCNQVSTSYDPVVEAWKKAAEDGKLTQEEVDNITKMTSDASYKLVDDVMSIETLKSFGLTEDGIRNLIETAIKASVVKRRTDAAKQLVA